MEKKLAVIVDNKEITTEVTNLYRMQKHSIRQRIQRKERWCRKMEKKLAVIVDNKEITTEVTNTEMCSSACDVAMGIRQRIQRKERWCRKMEKKLAVIVDNKEITTEVTNTEMCSSACDVAMGTCSSECHDTCGKYRVAFQTPYK